MTMKIGKAIKIARIKRGLQQKELAESLGVSANYISLLENDKRDPSWSFICRASDALKTPIPLLLLFGTEGGTQSLVGSDIRSQIAGHLLGILVAEDPGEPDAK